MLSACLQEADTLGPPPPPQLAGCAFGETIDASEVPTCLLSRHVLSQSDADSAARVIGQATGLKDYFYNDTGLTSFTKAADLARALSRMGDYYSRGLFADSARFHRLIDHLLVTIESTRGPIRSIGGRLWPQTTPFLAWHKYPIVGYFFQPVETVQSMGFPLPRPTAPTDSIVNISEHLYSYAVWRSFRGHRLPYWEYDFPFSTAGIQLIPPWVSGMAQGSTLFLFTEALKRTGDATWRSRGSDVLRSMIISWDEGGVLLPDTSHGYWFEEYHPTAQVWNGGAQALVSVGYYSSVTGDTMANRIFQRGIEAIKYYTPIYDTGTWTLYSRIEGYNSRFYHNFEIQLLDQLYTLSGDAWFKGTADRWRSYIPPAGVQ